MIERLKDTWYYWWRQNLSLRAAWRISETVIRERWW